MNFKVRGASLGWGRPVPQCALHATTEAGVLLSLSLL